MLIPSGFLQAFMLVRGALSAARYLVLIFGVHDAPDYGGDQSRDHKDHMDGQMRYPHLRGYDRGADQIFEDHDTGYTSKCQSHFDL